MLLLLSLALLSAEPTAASDPHFAAELIFSLHAQHNHAPGIVELPGGDLFASWYRGSGERRADDVAVYGARRRKGAQEWSEPFLLADTPGFPDCNTCLIVDPQKRLWLFYPTILANTWESCLTNFKVSSSYDSEGCPKWDREGILLLKPDDFGDEAKQLLDQELGQLKLALTDDLKRELDGMRAKLGDKLYQRLGWQPRCKPTILPSGRMLVPLYSDTFSISIMAITDDGGQTWQASKPLIGFGNIQPAVLRRGDGTLVAYMRENGPRNRIRICQSQDDGLTWGKVDSSELPNPGSGLDGLRLAGGHWLLVYNDTVQGRHRLAVSLSTDEGRSWRHTRHLENQEGGSFHYPAVTQGADGTIHCVYSYFVAGGKSMKHAAFTEAWITSAPTAAAEEPLFVARAVTKPGEFTAGIEGPNCDREGNIYAVNFAQQGTIGRVTPDGRGEVFVVLPQGSVGNGIVFDRAGMMFVADYPQHNVLKIDPATRKISVLGHEPAMNQPNDLAIAPDGTLYASDPDWKNSTGQLWRIGRDGKITRVAEEMGTTNGIEVSPDGKTLYVNESVQRNVWAFPILADGSLGAKKLIKQFPDHGFDGMRCDREGNLYITRHGKGTVVKMTPAGEILQEIDVLGKQPTNLCFGGPDGRTIYVTEVEHTRLVSFRVDQPGLAWQRWHEKK